MSRYRTQHVATAPAGWRVRSKRAGGHVVRIAFPPGRRKKGAGQVVEVLHPKLENPGCDVERKNPEQLLIFGLGNPSGDTAELMRRFKKGERRGVKAQRKYRELIAKGMSHDDAYAAAKKHAGMNPGGGFGNHKPGCPCAFCQRAAKLQSGELQPPALPNRSRRKRNAPADRMDWSREMVKRLTDSYNGMVKAGWSKADALAETLRRTTAGRGAIAEFKKRIGENPGRKGRVKATAKKSPARGAFSRKKNPDDTQQAVQLYQTFHGKDPRGVVEKQEPAIMREDYAAIGPLEYLLIKSPLGQTYKVEFEGDGVILASSPDGKQLYCIGGNQNLSAVLDADSLQKDFIDLGECLEVQYLARKVHSNFEPVSWHHKFGEKGGERPELVYDKLNKRIFFAGGAYFIDTSAEISPGIEN